MKDRIECCGRKIVLECSVLSIKESKIMSALKKKFWVIVENAGFGWYPSFFLILNLMLRVELQIFLVSKSCAVGIVFLFVKFSFLNYSCHILSFLVAI